MQFSIQKDFTWADLHNLQWKGPPVTSKHFPTRIHCCAGFTLWLWELRVSRGAMSGEDIRNDFGVWLLLSHLLYLAVYGKLRLTNSLHKTQILCLVFCVLCAIPLGKNCMRCGALGHQALILTFPALPQGWECPHGSSWRDFLHVEEAVYRKCSSFSVLTQESKHSYSYGSITGRVSERFRGGISPKFCTFSIPKSISQICIFYMPNQSLYVFHPFLPNEIDGSVAGFKMKLTPAPEMLLKPMALAQGLCYCWHKVRSVASVLLTELNIYTPMSPDSPNPRKCRFPISILFSSEQRREEKSCYSHPFLSSYKGNVLYPSSFAFIWIVLKDFKCVYCKNTPQSLILYASGDFYLGIPTQGS